MSRSSREDKLPPAEIRILQAGDEKALEAFLLPRIDSAMFLVGNMRAAGLHDRGRRYDGTYAAAFRGEEIVGVVAHYWNENLIVQAPDHLGPLWRAAAEASGRRVMGVIGPAGQVQEVKDALQRDPAEIQMDESEILYSLTLRDLVVPAVMASGRCRGRRARPADLDLLAEWRVAFSLEALGDEQSPELHERCRASIERSIQDGHLWVLECDDEPVATTAFNAAIREAVQVGGVWTSPQNRCQGYGRAAVASSLLDARAEGVEKAILFAGESNLPAQRAYVALGFCPIGRYRILLFR